MISRLGTALGLLASALFAAASILGCASSREAESAAAGLTESAAQNPTRGEAEALQARAEDFAQKAFLVDSHIDYPEARKAGEDPMGRTSGNFDYPRARAGGLDLAFIVAYVDPSESAEGRAFARAEEEIGMVRALAAANPERLALALSPEEAREAAAEGKLCLALGLENGSALEGRLDRVAWFAERDVSYITLCHVEDNEICDSSGDGEEPPRWGGLSPFGRELIAEMNRQGVMIDLAHASDEAVRQALELSTTPIIVTHTGCRSMTPGFGRNLPDDLMAAIAAKGGVVGMAFGSAFAVDAYRRGYSPRDLAAAKDIAASVDHAIKVAGIDHVGIGSDFDGVGYSLPHDLKDVSAYPNLARELMALGYDEDGLRKVFGENTLEVWAKARAGALPPPTSGRP